MSRGTSLNLKGQEVRAPTVKVDSLVDRASGPDVTLRKAYITVFLFTREARNLVENGAESGAEGCCGGIRNSGRRSGEQIGQSRISASADPGGNWQERRQDINKQTG